MASWTDIPLWPHQSEAVKRMQRYIAAFSRYARDGVEQRSALVRMPTGTGKSGIIAVLARCLADRPVVLVVVPWAALRAQLRDDINSRFWSKAGADPGPWPKPVHEFFPSDATIHLQEAADQPTVLLCTTATLCTLHREQWPDYNTLGRLVSLVLVDEGHREPAPDWALAVRQLKKPTILFTATPYRNDHKMFNVDPGHVYVLTHRSAVEDRFIREVKFREQRFERSREAFVRELLDFYDGDFQRVRPGAVDEARVIVRCETSDDVNHVAALLQGRGRLCIAIHERFSDDEEKSGRLQAVPNPEKCSATFWVHQFKLVEGIDDPRFCLLAVCSPFRNARALVQQVGRVVRNPGREPEQFAYIFSHADDRQSTYWQAYRAYEAVFASDPDKYEPRALFDNTVALQPEYQYFEGNFRERLSLKQLEQTIHLHLAYPRSAKVVIVRGNFSLDTAVANVEDEWRKEDKDVRAQPRIDSNTRVLVYQTYHNSPFLIRHSLLEFSIGFTVIHRVRNYVFFYDSAGGFSTYLRKNSTRVPPSTLERLFLGRRARLSQVSLMNSDVGKHSVRRRVLHAYSIADTAPSLVDHAHFCSTATGYTTAQERALTRRYVGFSRARISDPSSVKVEFADYVRWLDSLAAALDRARIKALPVFARYASHGPPPDDPTPRNILFDLDEVIQDFVTVETEAKSPNPLLLNEKCYEIHDGMFTCEANSTRHVVSVDWDAAERIYRLESKTLERGYARRRSPTQPSEENLLSFLNREQPFTVVPASPGVIYAHSWFYRPRLPLWGSATSERLDLLRVFVPRGCLRDVDSEKGHRCPDSDAWETGSLFCLIDNLGRPRGLEPGFDNVDLLVCDDLGGELADFIAASRAARRVVFIHAKARKHPSSTSASAFQEVCGQATKNLAWLHPYSGSTPPSVKKWSRPWVEKRVGKVERRIRRGPQDPAQVWRELQELIRDPLAQREVWIVLGKGFSLSAYQAERGKPNPGPETVQLFFLLQSTWTAVSSIGATLRVYCSP
jgi:superfamily II DNA or RNA helicase